MIIWRFCSGFFTVFSHWACVDCWSQDLFLSQFFESSGKLHCRKLDRKSIDPKLIDSWRIQRLFFSQDYCCSSFFELMSQLLKSVPIQVCRNRGRKDHLLLLSSLVAFRKHVPSSKSLWFPSSLFHSLRFVLFLSPRRKVAYLAVYSRSGKVGHASKKRIVLRLRNSMCKCQIDLFPSYFWLNIFNVYISRKFYIEEINPQFPTIWFYIVCCFNMCMFLSL